MSTELGHHGSVDLCDKSVAGLGFTAVVDFATSDFETCPKYQNWANFINKSTTESYILRSAMNPDPIDLRAAWAVAAKSKTERASFISVMVMFQLDLLKILPVESD